MMELKRSSPSLFGQITMGKFAGYQDGAYTLSFPQNPAVAIYANFLKREDRRQAVEQALTKAGGVPARFMVVQEGAPAVSKDAQAEAQKRLNHVFSVFGRENVQVVDE